MPSGANGYRAGSAYIAVSPNFRGFQLAAAREAQKLRPIKVPVEYDTSREPTFKPAKPMKVPVTFDLKGGSFEEKLRARVRAASAALGDIEIGAATTEAEQKIRDLKVQLQELAGKRIGVDLNAGQATAEVLRLQRALADLGARSPEVHVQVDAMAAAVELNGVKAMADSVARKRPTIDVDADTGGATAKLVALQGFIAGMSLAHPIITVGIALAPLAAPLGAALAGGAMGLAGIGAGLAGGVGAGVLGALVLKQAVDGQKKVTEATKQRTTAVQGLKSAEHSLASAEANASSAQISATRAVADAERGLADARRSSARAITSAEESLADARRSAARADAAAAEQVANAQRQLGDANKRVQASEKALHQARRQAVRDLQDLRAQAQRNALDLRAAQFAAQDAQAKLADIETNVFASSNDIARVRLEAAQAEQKVSDARRKSTRDAADLAKAEATGGGSLGGVKAAQQQLAAARQAQTDARRQLADARKGAARARADGARSVARAERNLAQTRADAARQVANAQRNLSRARADGARQVAQAEAQVADARRRVAAAQTKLTAADSARAAAVAKLTPGQRRLLAATEQLKKAWTGFLRLVDAPLAGAGVAGMHALEKVLPNLAVFLRPVYRSLRDVFRLLGGDLGSKGAKQTARVFGVFSGHIVRDAYKGTKFFVGGLVDMLRAFMPFSRDMSGGIVNLMKRFRDWAAGLSKSKGFQSFIGYVKDNGPKVLSFFGQLIKFVVNVGVALAPLGELMLKGLVAGLKWLNSLPPGMLLAIAGGITAIGIAIAVALDANPLMLIVTGLVILGAGLAMAYKKVAWFRKGVQVAWRAIATVIAWQWDHVTKPTLKAFWWFLSYVLFPVIRFLWTKVVRPIFGLIGGFIKLWWNNVVRPIFKAYWAYLSKVLIPVIRFLWTKVVRPIFGWIGGRIRDVWNGVIRPVFQALNRWVGSTLVGAFDKGISAIGRIWNGLKDLARKPVNFLIGTVFNNGIRKIINAIPGVHDLAPIPLLGSGGGGRGRNTSGTPVSHHGATGRAARGGVLGASVLPGWTPGRDVHTFTSPTGGTLHLSGGEAIMRPEWTRRVGGPRAVARMNKAAASGHVVEQGFASGGVFASPSRPVMMDGKSISAIAAAQIRLAEEVSKTNLFLMQGGFGGSHVAASGSSHNYPGVADIGPASIGMEKVLRQVGFAAWARNIAGRSQVGSGAHVHAVSLLDPGDASSPQVTGSWAHHGNGLSGYNNDPAPHYAWLPNLRQRLGAMNLSALGGGGDGKGGFLGVIKTITGLVGSIKKWIGELTGMGGWGGLVKQVVTGVMGTLRSWVNGKIPGPGPIPAIFDNGGQLPQGLTLAYHGARKPDKVLTDAQWNDIHRAAAGRAAGPAKFDLYDRDGKLWGSMTGIARSAVNGHAELSAAAAGAGMGGLG